MIRCIHSPFLFSGCATAVLFHGSDHLSNSTLLFFFQSQIDDEDNRRLDPFKNSTDMCLLTQSLPSLFQAKTSQQCVPDQQNRVLAQPLTCCSGGRWTHHLSKVSCSSLGVPAGDCQRSSWCSNARKMKAEWKALSQWKVTRRHGF